jgi:hypothetical protein
MIKVKCAFKTLYIGFIFTSFVFILVNFSVEVIDVRFCRKGTVKDTKVWGIWYAKVRGIWYQFFVLFEPFSYIFELMKLVCLLIIMSMDYEVLLSCSTVNILITSYVSVILFYSVDMKCVELFFNICLVKNL